LEFGAPSRLRFLRRFGSIDIPDSVEVARGTESRDSVRAWLPVGWAGFRGSEILQISQSSTAGAATLCLHVGGFGRNSRIL
jgi:hypothetical protein